MRLISVPDSSGNDEDITAQEANNLVGRFGSLHIGDAPAFDDVSVSTDGQFHYVIDGQDYSVPVEVMRHRWQGGAA